MIYATWSKGFRSGGFNLRNTLPSVPGPYNEETVDAYEIGFKSDLLDRHVRFNTAAYINKNRGLQEVVAINQVQTVENAANATTRGFEADLTLIPISGLVFTGSLGYVDAKYDSFNSLDLNGDRIPDPALAVLLKLPQVPKWTYSAAANYQFSMGKIGLMSLRASWSHVDSRFADVINKVPLKAYDVIDASASLDINDHVSVGVYGKNLTNELYSQFGVYTSLFSYYFPSPPRSWFAEIRIKY